jgi:hypothetical protein
MKEMYFWGPVDLVMLVVYICQQLVQRSMQREVGGVLVILPQIGVQFANHPRQQESR